MQKCFTACTPKWSMVNRELTSTGRWRLLLFLLQSSITNYNIEASPTEFLNFQHKLKLTKFLISRSETFFSERFTFMWTLEFETLNTPQRSVLIVEEKHIWNEIFLLVLADRLEANHSTVKKTPSQTFCRVYHTEATFNAHSASRNCNLNESIKGIQTFLIWNILLYFFSWFPNHDF